MIISHDSNLSLLEDLKRKLKHLEGLFKHPDLLLSDYFDNLRREIDVEAESRILELLRDSEKSYQINSINNVRELLIAELNRCEVGLRGESIEKIDLQRLKHVIGSLQEPISPQSYRTLFMEMETIAKLFQATCLKDQSFIFLTARHFKKLKDFGVLIKITDYHLHEIDSEILNRLDHQDLSYTFEFLEDKLIQKAAINFEVPRTLTKDVLVLSNLCRSLYGCFTSEAKNQHIVEVKTNQTTESFSYKCCIEKSTIEYISENFFDFLKLARMDSLDLNNNRLTNLQKNVFDSLVNLTRLDLSQNYLTSIDEKLFSKLKQLKRLGLSFNRLKFINDNSFAELANLETLDLSNNRLIKLTQKLFRNLKLRSLNLSSNFLSSFDDELLRNQIHLKFLDLSSNRVDSSIKFNKLFERLKNVEHLIIGGYPEPHEAIEFSLPIPASLQILNLSNYQFKEVKTQFFDKFSYLRMLDLSNNRLTSIEILLSCHLEKLEELNLNGNCIETLPRNMFKKMSILRKLYISNNKLQNLPAHVFNGLNQLIDLDLSSNQISSYDPECLAGLTNLQIFQLANNQLQGLNIEEFLQSLTRVKHLIMSKNQIQTVSSVAFSNLKYLKALDMSYNQIESLNEDAFKTLFSLQHLNLSRNKLKSFDSSILYRHQAFCHLSTLDLSNNNLVQLDESSFRSLVILTDLNLSSNKLQSIDRWTLMSLESLLNLNLSDNFLEDIDKWAFNELSNLSSLDISNNRLEFLDHEIDLNFKKLCRFNLSGNRIRSIHHALPLSGNQMFEKLTEIDFSSNFVSSASLKLMNRCYSHVKSLRLEDIGLRGIKREFFSGYVCLERLDLSNNQIESIFDGNVFSDLASLIELKLDSNKLKRIHEKLFYSMKKLKSLSLSKNRLERLHDNLFVNLVNLEKLYLSENNLARFQVMALFRHAKRVKYLDLSMNLLDNTSFNVDSIPNSFKFELEHLDLRNNRLQCLKFVKGLYKLKTLLVRNNQINELLNKDALAELGNLKGTDLEGSRRCSTILSDSKLTRIYSPHLTGHSI